MKKRFLVFALITVLTIMAMTGCTTSKAFTYNVETGDSVKIELNTTGGFNITSELPFTILKDDEVQSQGIFITIDGYDQYMEAVATDDLAQVIETKSENGLEYTFYNYDDEEFNYIIKLTDANTGLLIGNVVSEESARECFDRLTITKE